MEKNFTLQKDYPGLLDYFSNMVKENKRLPFLTFASEAVHYLYDSFSTMDWVGFYLYDREEDVLYLGPYETGYDACEEIKPGKGVCGRALAEKRTIFVKDTSKESNYIACSSSTKSEIVVPVFDKDNNVIAVLDIDSDTLNAFNNKDQENLEALVKLIR